MALESLTPATRLEGILNGDDLAPVTREEYFLKKAATEVPKPESAADANKVLALGQMPVWETVVPLQTVTYDSGEDSPQLANSLMSQLTNGELCRMTVNDVSEEVTVVIALGLTLVSNDVYSMQYTEATGSSFTADVDGEYTVKLEKQGTPDLVPEWTDIEDIIPPAAGEDF